VLLIGLIAVDRRPHAGCHGARFDDGRKFAAVFVVEIWFWAAFAGASHIRRYESRSVLAALLLHGRAFPTWGLDVQLHPVAFAGWAGILITGLNLIPAGQFDGGHMLYVLFGRGASQRVLPFILVGLVLLGFVWTGWWLWAMLIFFLGRAYAEPLDQITPLDGRRKAAGCRRTAPVRADLHPRPAAGLLATSILPVMCSSLLALLL
jgi:hypothetical protein